MRSLVLFLLGIFLHGRNCRWFPQGLFCGACCTASRSRIFFCGAVVLFFLRDAHTGLESASRYLVGYWVLLTFVPVPGIGAPLAGRTGGGTWAHYLDEHFSAGPKIRGHAPEHDGLRWPIVCWVCSLGLLLKDDRVTAQRKAQLPFWAAGNGRPRARLSHGPLEFPIIKLLWTL